MQISVECPASRLHVCADFAIVSDKPEAVARSALMAEVPRHATPRTPRRPTVVRRELERGARRSAAAVKSEEEEAKVHFCDDVAAIKRRRASELAVVCGGGGGGRGKVII